MSITSEEYPIISYEGYDAVDTFSITFTFLRNQYLDVYLVDSDNTEHLMTENALGDYGYTVDKDNSTLTINRYLATGETVVIWRNTDFTQQVDYADRRKFSQALEERDYDKLTCILQELRRCYAIGNMIAKVTGAYS